MHKSCNYHQLENLRTAKNEVAEISFSSSRILSLIKDIVVSKSSIDCKKFIGQFTIP